MRRCKETILIFVFFLFTATNLVFADLNKGLVAYYPFNGNANDESGYANHGTVNGATLTYDRFGNEDSAYHFKQNTNIIIPDSEYFSFRNYDINISFWFKASGHCVFINHGTSGGNRWYAEVYGPITFKYWKNGAYALKLVGKTHVKSDTWHYYSFIRKGNTFELYLDDNLEASVTLQDLVFEDYETQLEIGSDYLTGGWTPVIGLMDDIRIYNSNYSDNICIDSDKDGVIDQWDNCPETPLNSYVNSNGCPLIDNSALSGRILMKGQPLTEGNATLFQSGELFQKSPIDKDGCYRFENVSEEKSINIMIRKSVE